MSQVGQMAGSVM